VHAREGHAGHIGQLLRESGFDFGLGRRIRREQVVCEEQRAGGSEAGRCPGPWVKSRGVHGLPHSTDEVNPDQTIEQLGL
jgi:hypothetical protein